MTPALPVADANLVAKEDADSAFDAAACIGCGACIAACPNASAMGKFPSGTPLPALPNDSVKLFARPDGLACGRVAVLTTRRQLIFCPEFHCAPGGQP